MKARLLIVDDEEVILSLLKTVLQSQGYSVTTAGSGAEAKAVLAADEGLDLVITDMRMETETAGYEVVEAAVAPASRPADWGWSARSPARPGPGSTPAPTSPPRRTSSTGPLSRSGIAVTY